MNLKQNIYLEVWDAPDGGIKMLDATGLRVDFDVRDIPEFSRGVFTIYNLTDETIKNLASGERYVTLKVQLHDGEVQLLANRFFVNNLTDELILPDRITKLFCFDRLRNTYLEKQVSLPVGNNPSLKNMVDSLLQDSGYGTTQDTDFKSFPAGVIYQPSKKSTRVLNGSAQQNLRKLGKEFHFEVYTTVSGRIEFQYYPDIKNVNKTTLATKVPDVILSTRSMRSNPKIGIGSCTIHNLLDGRIRATSVLDLSKLLVVAVEGDDETLQLVENYVQNFSANSKYTAFAVTHTGSNYTAEWSTRITGYSPTRGKLMPTYLWAGRTK